MMNFTNYSDLDETLFKNRILMRTKNRHLSQGVLFLGLNADEYNKFETIKNILEEEYPECIIIYNIKKTVFWIIEPDAASDKDIFKVSINEPGVISLNAIDKAQSLYVDVDLILNNQVKEKSEKFYLYIATAIMEIKRKYESKLSMVDNVYKMFSDETKLILEVL